MNTPMPILISLHHAVILPPLFNIHGGRLQGGIPLGVMLVGQTNSEVKILLNVDIGVSHHFSLFSGVY